MYIYIYIKCVCINIIHIYIYYIIYIFFKCIYKNPVPKLASSRPEPRLLRFHLHGIPAVALIARELLPGSCQCNQHTMRMGMWLMWLMWFNQRLTIIRI